MVAASGGASAVAPRRDLVFRSRPFADGAFAGHIDDPDDLTYAEITKGSELFGLIAAYTAKHAETCRSYILSVGRDKAPKKPCGPCVRHANGDLGLGVFKFTWQGEASMYVLHETIEGPLASNCGADFYSHLVLATPGKGKVAVLTGFCDALLAEADRPDENSFTVYRWNVSNQFWMRDMRVPARPLESVVLPAATKERVVRDLDEFQSEETSAWYRGHGIPYKRAYLFYGEPGAGKTSLIQALAGRYQRNVAYLSPTHPEMTDDSLKAAIQRAPASSLLVLEDVDALFAKDRQKKVAQSPLTFSGLLNALDGVGSPSGQVFVLTTNFRDELDAALIRNGRVDLHVEFCAAAPEQVRQIFRQFYPAADEALAADFEAALSAALGGRTVSMAVLQHYFILQRRKSAAEAAANVGEIVAEIEQREAKEKPQPEEKSTAKEKPEEKSKADRAKRSEEGGAEDEGAEDVDEQPLKGVPPIHVHIHTGSGGRGGGGARRKTG